jgi:hypothetical protein
VLLAVLALGVLAGVMLAGRSLDAAGSSVSRGATGWLAARAYLERRGTPTRLVERPLQVSAEDEGEEGAAMLLPPAGKPGTLVLVFPWQSPALSPPLDAIHAHLAAGGDLLIGYSGEAAPAKAETDVLDALDATPDILPRASLVPWRWRIAMGKPWALTPSAAWRGAPPSLTLRKPRWVPSLPRDGALLSEPGGRVVAATWAFRGGRVLVLPAELLCNARLAEAANADLLESLRRHLHGPWRFDELHHGLVAAGEPLPTATGRGLDLVLLQLLLLYVVAAIALGRRLGPAWREAPPIVGSAASFLLRLGALHDRLGHHREGAELLLRRAGELDRRFTAGPALRRRAAEGDAAALVEVGRFIARSQRRG